MKELRIVGNIIIGVILFVLILSLSLVKTSKVIIEKDLVVGLVKTAITETLEKETNKIEDNKDAIIDEIFSDKETDNVVHIVIDNFKKYQDGKTNFSVSDSDVEKITTFALKYKNQISKIAGNKIEELTDEKIKELLSKDNINKISNRIYEELSSSVGDEVDLAFNVYDKMTSSSITWITVGVIIFLIIILGLINWSLYKWMITTGVCLIISGSFMCLVYLGCLFIKEIIKSVNILNKALGSVSFEVYVIVGGLELLIGIILVVTYNLIKNKPLNEQINNLGVGE